MKNINEILFGEFKVLYNMERKNSAQKNTGLTEEDKAMTQQLLAELDEIEALQAVKEEVDFIDELNEFMVQEEENFCEEIDSVLEEAEKLYTAELLAKQQEVKLECDRNCAILDFILTNDDMKNIYGNKTITRHRELAPLLNKIPTGCDKSIIELAMASYRCTYNQALSKLAVAFNINYNRDNTWFKQQMDILEHNRNLLMNPAEIVIKYPKLWNKIKKEAHMRKYFFFLLDLFQTQIEQKGVSYKATSKPLIASASFRFTASSVGRSYKATVKNMNSLAQFHLTRKLTDKKVKQIDKSMHEKIIALTQGWRTTITTYELVLWDDELLQYANDKIQENRRNKVTHRGQTAKSLEVIGDSDIVNKSNKELSQKEKDDIAVLKKWFRKKIFDKGGCGFVTKDDYEARFNNPDEKNTVWAGQDKRAEYLEIIFAELNLKSEPATKELKTIMNRKKLNNVKHQTHVYIPAEIANQLNKYNN